MWIASPDEWSSHGCTEEVPRFLQQIRVRENVDHLSESWGKIVGSSVRTSAAECCEGPRFVISANDFDSPAQLLSVKNLLDHEIGSGPLRQQIPHENDSGLSCPASKSVEHLSEFLATAVDVSDHDRVTHRRTILSFMPIRTLSSALVNQIAAGEVIERPASVAKELVENAIDAGATRIVVRIEGGGRERLEVIDDGDGIPHDELSLALAPHSTSKLTTSEDLNRIRTLGFRGEALCAISSVSHVKLASATRGNGQSWTIESRFGEVSEAKPSSGPPGTSIVVAGLFSNVPARRKFLRGDPAEAARVTEVVCNAALSHPSVAFRLESGGRKVLDFATANDCFGRVSDVFGDALGQNPLTVAGEAIGEEFASRVLGIVCRPASMRSVSRTQRIFVNGRPIVDRSLVHAVREAYRGLAEPSLQPVFAIFLTVDPSLVDVNVHPQKSEVRWSNPSWMHRLVYRSVQDALRSEDLTVGDSRLISHALSDSNGIDPRTAPSSASVSTRSAVDRASPSHSFSHSRVVMEEDQGHLLAPPVAVRQVLQVNDTWLILAEDDAVVIVDQHALHERVMFEEIRSRIGGGDLMSQRLMIPATADVSPESLANLETLGPLFARLGIEVTAVGPRTIAVHAFPGFLIGRKVDAATFVVRALCDESLASAATSSDDSTLREQALADILDMMACKAAVKGGDRLSREEIAELLSARSTTDRSSNCPHGRPTSIRIPIIEIERRFGRR